MNTLAWSLLHFLWQGAAITAVAAALMYVFRKPATRYLIGVSSLGLMLLSFIVTFSLLSSIAELPAAATAAGAPAAALVPPTGTSALPQTPWTEVQAATDSSFDFAWLARGWLLGVFVLALRIAFGLFVLEQLRRRNLVALPDALVARFRALQSRLGIQRAIRYAECHLVNVPAVIGFFRPVVLIPMRALTGLSQEQLEALVAHELGHIKRFDVAVNFVQVIAETLFFFHPAVWWLNKRIRADREDCCDDIAVSAGGSSVGYAKALATIANWRDVPSFAMAATGGPVAARVARLLGMNRQNDGARTAGVFTASLVLMGALLAGAVSLGLSKAVQAQTAENQTTEVVEATASEVDEPVVTEEPTVLAEEADAAESAKPAKPPKAAKPAKPAKPAKQPSLAPLAPIAPAAAPAPRPMPMPTVAPAPRVSPQVAIKHDGSYLDEMRAAGLGETDVDTLIALKSQGVTPEYIRAMRATGIKISLDEIVGMKIQGVTPEYVQQVRSLGYDVNADELIAFKVHDVSPQFVEQIKAMGFKTSADEIIGMKVQGIDAQYVKSLRDLGLKFSSDDIVAMKVHGITPDYVQKMRAGGFQMDTDDLIAMKVHDVTPEFRKALESNGFKVDTDQVIHAKVMDISVDFIAKAKAHGFVNLDIDQLIALKNADVL